MLAFGTLCQIFGNVDFDYQLLGLSMIALHNFISHCVEFKMNYSDAVSLEAVENPYGKGGIFCKFAGYGISGQDWRIE